MLFNNESFEKINKEILSQFAKSIPNGEYADAHGHGRIGKCKYIVLLSGGQICPLHEKCSLNPFKKSRDGSIYLSGSSCGGTFIQRSEDIEEAIKLYNEELLETISEHIKDDVPFWHLMNDIIVAYYEF